MLVLNRLLPLLHVLHFSQFVHKGIWKGIHAMGFVGYHLGICFDDKNFSRGNDANYLCLTKKVFLKMEVTCYM